MNFGVLIIGFNYNLSSYVSVIQFYVLLKMTTLGFLEQSRKRLNTLPPTPNWSPYIFTLVQKEKKSVINNSCFYKQSKVLPRLCKLFHLKMTCTFCTGGVRVKVPSFQTVTQFLQYKIFHRGIINLNFCLFEDIPDCRDLRRIISYKSFASIGIFVSSTYK